MTRTTHFSRPRAAGGVSRSASDSTAAHDDEEARLEELENEEAEGSSYEETTDWGRIGSFAAGLAAGLTIGAGVALLLAPASGEETREYLSHRARSLRSRADTSWDDLRDELRWLARRGRKKMRRGVTMGRWRAEDAIERQRRRRGW
ncbi:MAG TPA: YtxH domain-containing protein [Gemmatimonadaceae bacterium]|nr:YtxH domain-containing protein [Gemmatimonadaceae bacterium]